MTWIFLVIGFHFLWALGNTGDKYILEKRIDKPLVYAWLIEALGLLGLLILPFVNFSFPDLYIILIIAFGALIWFVGDIAYLRALELEEVSRVNILWGLVPLFGLLLSWLFIGEVLSTRQFLAFFVLLFGTIIASIHVHQERIHFSKGFWYMVVACLSYAGYAVVTRSVTLSTDQWIVYVLNLVFIFLWSLTLFTKRSYRKDVKEFFRKNRDLSIFKILIVISLFNTIAYGLNVFALSKAPAALVVSFSGLQAAFVFGLALLISKYKPSIFVEKFDAKNAFLKLIALIFVVLGIYILSIK